MNARFWAWMNGDWVKITLKPFQYLQWSHGYRHEEGWSRTTITYRHDGQDIKRTIWDEGADCDGRHSSHSTYLCHTTKLHAVEKNDEQGKTTMTPDWQRDERNCGQRDYAAEAAGY